MQFTGRGVLLDIEGTTSSIRFVYDVLFPFVLRELDRFLETSWSEPPVRAAAEQIARDAGHGSLDSWRRSDDRPPQQLIAEEVRRLMADDVKATGLKQLQGLIWEDGFRSGELKAHVYDDVPPALRAWRDQGFDLRIYSSGSIQAQKLFFQHTEQGDLLPLLNDHYDTTTGPKKQPESYAAIADAYGLTPAAVLFLSDNVEELRAAREAGMQTLLCVRPGNPPVASDDFPEIRDFASLDLQYGDAPSGDH